ncbi:MAG: hypothetical protein F6K40_27365 [Okeania sp. SIO3I5]|uniref:hypothetical protein n=1 Tax=Okeania sp. SIO3I5 TaxID=2607805 RepID=UPI0013BC6ECC|nr:hypothetical protein [Okeania sp. SIO3I5]NEQ39766.1 hypothetical protein [Okeania sp. SIO3I5]
MSILLFKKLGLIALIPVCLTVFFGYPSFSKNYTLNKKNSPNENQILKLNKPQSVKHISQHSNTYTKNGMEVFKDGCIIKSLRLRNGMNLKIKQNCN